ncbi:methyltransferase family protein [Yimella lutea]|uniref:Methyltransferase family protein n=1 Tax=Yimella lutea TaxID=587872 RepID=A0A542EDG4_9MICO|nr:class I SAM-dependent methyltransferase [Yimella lutea]TQJ13368.1 methyltransferase family protein [Yimella lutea]
MNHTGLHADPELLTALAADLRSAAFTVDGVQQRLGPVAAAALHREQVTPARRVVTDDDPLDVLIRFFTLGDAVPGELLDVAVPGLRSHGLRELGLLADDGRARFDLRPHADDTHDWWVVSDLSELVTGGPLPDDHVLGIGGASTTLASWTVRRPAARALDMGAGCGVQALHLGAHCERIVATDLSARAVEILRFNAVLNGERWDVRSGSLFEPVAGERFDLIVSNPPFVITPRVAGVPLFEYRDGGMVGDSLVRTVVHQVEAHLEPGGVAQLLGNWEVPAGTDWQDVVRQWLAPTELDAWVVQRETQDPAEYAELWIRDGGHRPGTEAYERMYAAWLDDFDARGVASIGFGVITLQRPATKRRRFQVLEEHSGPVASPMGPAVDAELAALTWCAEHPDEVLDQNWRVADDVTEERFAAPGADDPSVIRITQGGGLGRQLHIDTAISAYLSVADGDLTARQALVAIATLLERDERDLLERAQPIVTRLVETGFLVGT